MTLLILLQGFLILLIFSDANLRVESTEVNVPFPPAQPTEHNLAAICSQGQGRPRYLESFFPRRGAGHFRRRGTAINRLESWYQQCCSLGGDNREAAVLCCTRQSWKQALGLFCIEEFGTMTAHYECCLKQGVERWSCFDSELPNPDYLGTPGCTAPEMPVEPDFTFDPNAC